MKKSRSMLIRSAYSKLLLGLGLLLLSVGMFTTFIIVSSANENSTPRPLLWKFQSIDTMKYSRDLSREKLSDPLFDHVIDQQVGNIAKTGATHVGIATPYDKEFYPMLERWVASARRYNLKVWFRGNFSGWEGWFEYSKISRAQHIQQAEAFILGHPEIFADGDVFSACPECENGGPGDPRQNGDAEGHRKFLIDEYAVTKSAFTKINKRVASNYHSMNGDVTRLIMDRKTTKALDGIVVIDHYVSSPEKMRTDILDFAKRSGGKVILGEFGAPIPDVNGEMTEQEQAAWLDETLKLFAETDAVIGMNYWVNVGGSTELWDANGNPRLAVNTLRSYFTPDTTKYLIQDPLGQKITDASVQIGTRLYKSDATGNVAIPTRLLPAHNVTISAKNHNAVNGELEGTGRIITLERNHLDLAYRIRKLFLSTLNFGK